MATIIIYASNAIGKTMAGPAIRSWEFANALCRDHSVILIAPNQPTISTEKFILIAANDPAVKEHLKKADALIAQTLPIRLTLLAKRYGVTIILDAYDPVPLEFLELFKHHSPAQRNEKNNQALLRLTLEFQLADSIICASEKQRDLWMGALLAQRRLTPAIYDQDSSLRELIDVVPFGLSKTPPQKTGPGLREKHGLATSDKIILWGGGIWNWFDPLSLIQAIKQLSLIRSDIKLVFMGIKNPDDKVPEMKMCQDAIQLAKELDLLDRFVFFNYGWVPYEERQNVLLEATIGVSTHFDHLETRYSFRTRMLDYIWAGLPIVATQGDSFADLIDSHQLGLTVPYQDPSALAKALVGLVDDPQKIQAIKDHLASMRHRFFWDVAIAPIDRMIKRFENRQSRLSYQDLKQSALFAARYLASKRREKGVGACLSKLFKKH